VVVRAASTASQPVRRKAKTEATSAIETSNRSKLN
jgi:hypothetical protein